MDELPRNPLTRVADWLAEAVRAGRQRNPDAMALATANLDAEPSVRMVLLKTLDTDSGFGVFYTNYESRKGTELAVNQRAAAVLYWPDFGRQVRLEGPVHRSPASESAAYFATRPVGSQLNAWVSAQSRPLDDPDSLAERLAERARDLGIAAGGETGAEIPLPPHWGGYRLWIDRVELWTEGKDRFHERILYARELKLTESAAYRGGEWRRRFLQP